MAAPSKDQYSGCLIGQCLGDALGLPVEGCPREVCREYLQREIRSLRDTSQAHVRGAFPFGQYSDDSQLARELLQSYATLGRFDPQDYAARIAAIFAEGRIVGRGLATHLAAERLIQGTHWEEAGTPAPAAGNGSAMRAGPIGLLFADDPDQLIRAAQDQGRITHKDPRCSAGAVAIAGAVALATRPEEILPEQWLRQLCEWVQVVDPEFGSHVVQLSSWVLLPPDEAVQKISRCGLSPDFQDDWIWISPFVVTSVLWSLYSFLRSPEDYEETICTAIAAGGDVDTTAAMAGAISGAHIGLSRLPESPVQSLTDQGTWGFPELVELARSCHDVKYRVSSARGS